MQHLRTSIEGYRTATTLTESPVLLLDCGYNLAQSLVDLADILEDTTGQPSEVRSIREEAAVVLGQVLDGQEEFLARQAEEGDEVIEEAEDGAEGEAMDVEGDAAEPADDEGEGAGSFETYLPTRSTLIDTVLAIVDLHMSMWESAEPLASPSEVSQSLVRSVLDRAGALCPPERQPELDLVEIKVLLAVDEIVWDLYRGEAKVGTGVENSIEGATVVLSKLLDSVTDTTGQQGTTTTPTATSLVQAEILTTLADTHYTLAARQVFLLPQLPQGPSHLAQQAWYHYGQAVTRLSKALDLPTSADTPREFKPSVYLNLARASLERARLRKVNDTAKRNAEQLMENAWTYASKAAEGLGWKMFSLEPSSSMSLGIGMGTGNGNELPPPAGWDTETLGRDIVVASLRICLLGSRTDILPENLRGKYETGLTGLLGKLKLGKIPVERRINGKEVKSRIEEIRDDGPLEDCEAGFWDDCITQLGA